MLFLCASCGEKASENDGKYYVSYTVDSLTYETEDGIWSEDDRHAMIDRYYNEKAKSVPVKIRMKFTANEPFHYAMLTCKGGIGEIQNASAFLYDNYNNTLGTLEESGELLPAGSYMIEISDASYRFYARKGTMLPAFDRSSVKLITSLDIIRFEATE